MMDARVVQPMVEVVRNEAADVDHETNGESVKLHHKIRIVRLTFEENRHRRTAHKMSLWASERG